MVKEPTPSDRTWTGARATRTPPTVFGDQPPTEPWILRRLIACRKEPVGGTMGRWSRDSIPTRFGPYPRSRPAGRLTEWRAVRTSSGPYTFILLCLAQTARDDFRAWLVLEEDQQRSVIERWEHHGGHNPDGIHSHTWCAERHAPMGAASIDAPTQIPGTRSRHRRSGVSWSKETFWIAACRRFKIDLPEIDQDALSL